MSLAFLALFLYVTPSHAETATPGDTAGDDESDSSCGCATTPAEVPAAAVMGLMALGLLRRRVP
jgi:uncharacterized protein (TIGR03382 family)